MQEIGRGDQAGSAIRIASPMSAEYADAAHRARSPRGRTNISTMKSVKAST